MTPSTACPSARSGASAAAGRDSWKGTASPPPWPFSEQPDRWIRTHLNVIALRTAAELRGTPCIPLELAPPPRKGLVVSRMFGRKLTEFEPVKQALVAYVTRAAEKLRRDGLRRPAHAGVPP